MNNETDLDWLARHVHVWPEGKCEVLVCWPRNADTLIWSSVLSDAGWTTKEQWLDRRAELQNKPSWDKAEDWAEWLAQDQDGEWKWLAGLPGKYVDGWTAVKIKGCCKGLALGDWRDTLEKRPEEFQPFPSIEDNQEKAMKQDNGWFERGELPPVGTRCVALLGIAPKANCEVIAKTEQQMVVKWEENGMMDVIDLDVHAAFRPILTEREELESLLRSTALSSFDDLDIIAGAIIAAGFRKEKK